MFNCKLILKCILAISLNTLAQTTITLQQGTNNYSGCEDISVADKNTPGYKYMESTYEPESSRLCAAYFTC